jgi:GNAT superfamily N-acetyltransferase
MEDLSVRAVSFPCAGFEPLRREAELEGFRFFERLVSDWESGRNRFEEPGECFVGGYVGGHLVAVGGLNRDPFIDPHRIGRLRHLFVSRRYRRQGVGSAIVDHLLRQARSHFAELHLRTESTHAASFYVRLGFRAVIHPTASHIKRL